MPAESDRHIEIFRELHRLCERCVRRSRAAGELLAKLHLFKHNGGLVSSGHFASPVEALLVYIESELSGLSPISPECCSLRTLSDLVAPTWPWEITRRDKLTQLLASMPSKGSNEYFSGFPWCRVDAPQSVDFESEFDVDSQDEAHNPLYQAIESQTHCICLGSQNGQQHMGRLELKETAKTDQLEQITIYDTAFARSCGTQQPLLVWARLRFHVTGTVRKVVRFMESDVPTSRNAVQTSQQNNGSHCPTVFCHLFKVNPGPAYTCLQVSTHELVDIKQTVPAFELDRDPGQTLFELLKRYRLSDAAKLFLARDICTSVWRFYKSDWMKFRWTGNEISFVRRLDKCPDSEYLVPFISMRFNQDSENELAVADEYRKGGNFHCAPRILALAVMLICIFGQGIEERGDNVNFRLNSEWTQCTKQLKPNAKWPMLEANSTLLSKAIREAVAACLELKDLGTQNSMTLDERRDYLFRKVVCRFHNAVAWCGFRREQVCLADQADCEEGAFGGSLTSQSDIQSILNHVSVLSGTRGSLNPEKWLDKIAKSTLNIDIGRSGPKRFLHRTNRIKIAILDTGYDPGCVFFGAQEKVRIIGYHDFVATRQDYCTKADEMHVSHQPCDTSDDGHGTFVLSLAMRVAKHAEFYVARVSEGSTFEGDTPALAERIAKAIRWAEASGVHIISMSFGFDEEEKQILQAIDEVVTQKRDYRILFFSAVSNQGLNADDIDFPARHSSVFGIHALGHFGDQPDFDTKAGFEEAVCFGTLGKGVNAYVSNKAKGSDAAYKALDGTSFATPVAASIAAMILDAAILSDWAFEYLVTFRGMKKMFEAKEISKLHTQQRYRYLNPEAFFSFSESRRKDVLKYVFPNC